MTGCLSTVTISESDTLVTELHDKQGDRHGITNITCVKYVVDFRLSPRVQANQEEKNVFVSYASIFSCCPKVNIYLNKYSNGIKAILREQVFI